MSDTEEKISISEILYGIVFTPTKIFTVFRYYKPWGQALIFLTAINIILTLLYFLGSEWEQILVELPNNISSFLLPLRTSIGFFMGVLFFPFSMLFFMLHAAFFHLLSEMLGGHGEALGIFSALAFIQVLSLLSGVLNFFIFLLGDYAQVISPLVAFIFVLWQIVVSIIALREIYFISTSKAVLVFFLPVIILFCLIIFMIITTVAFLTPMLESFNSLTL